ncbi:hypothetical protein ACR6C2_39380 [Streptomyces sp. INA 01156]
MDDRDDDPACCDDPARRALSPDSSLPALRPLGGAHRIGDRAQEDLPRCTARQAMRPHRDRVAQTVARRSAYS